VVSPFAIAWGLAAAALAASLAWRHRPAPARSRSLAAAEPSAIDGAPGPRPRTGALGGALTSAGRLAYRVAGRAPGDDEAARRLGGALAAALAVAVLVPAAAPAAGLAVWLLPAHRRRRSRVRARAAVAACVPEVVDLFSLAVGAGLTVPLALRAVADRATGPVGDALRHAVGQVEVGARVGDALDALPRTLGEAVRPLAAALVASDRYGVPLAGTLERLAADVRADRRRWAEDAARRVPVKLLFPLVVCILPAFALLTVVPLAASALGSLRL
jgi:Flp pilus assembly protein TadB